jgi:hypothetical protein
VSLEHCKTDVMLADALTKLAPITVVAYLHAAMHGEGTDVPPVASTARAEDASPSASTDRSSQAAIRVVKKTRYTHLWGLITCMVVSMVMISTVPSIAESAPALTDSWNGSHFISENMHFNAHDRSNRELYASARGSLCKQWHEDSIAPDRNGSKHPGFKPYYPHVEPAPGESIGPMDFQDEYEKFLEQRPWI